MWLRSRGWRAKLQAQGGLPGPSRSRCRPSDGGRADLLRDRGGFPPLADGPSRQGGRAAGRLLEEGLRQALDRLAARRATRLCASAGSTASASRSATESYTIRFTPRRKGSIWSKVNVAPLRGADRRGPDDPGRRARLRGEQAAAAASTPMRMSQTELTPGGDGALQARTRRPGPIGRSGRPATARSCSTGSPARRSRRRASAASRP